MRTSGLQASATSKAKETVPTWIQIFVFPSEALRMLSLQSTRDEREEGAKSHAAQGFSTEDLIVEKVSGREAPQQINPTPIGRIPEGVFGIEELEREILHSSRREERLVTSVPRPRNPTPWARDTARASSDCAIRRIGAEVIRGEVGWTQG